MSINRTVGVAGGVLVRLCMHLRQWAVVFFESLLTVQRLTRIYCGHIRTTGPAAQQHNQVWFWLFVDRLSGSATVVWPIKPVTQTAQRQQKDINSFLRDVHNSATLRSGHKNILKSLLFTAINHISKQYHTHKHGAQTQTEMGKSKFQRHEPSAEELITMICYSKVRRRVSKCRTWGLCKPTIGQCALCVVGFCGMFSMQIAALNSSHTTKVSTFFICTNTKIQFCLSRRSLCESRQVYEIGNATAEKNNKVCCRRWFDGTPNKFDRTMRVAGLCHYSAPEYHCFVSINDNNFPPGDRDRSQPSLELHENRRFEIALRFTMLIQLTTSPATRLRLPLEIRSPPRSSLELEFHR